MKWLKRLLYFTVFLAVAAAAVWVSGPREPKDTTITFDPAAIGSDPDAWLAAAEAKVPNIRPGLQKEIVWAYPESKAKTPVALVVVHGFSASKGELRPVPDIVAGNLSANLYYTRMTGHGQDGAAMLSGSVNAWVNDFAEALAIGRLLGEKVVILSVSTGGSLSAWAATQSALMDKVAGIVFVSPNFALVNQQTEILSLPFAGTLADLIVGKEREFETFNEAHKTYWTYKYPTRALLPMKAAVDLAAAQNYANVKVPALFIYRPDDQVVDETVTARVAEMWGGKKDTFIPGEAEDPFKHVIAGDALSPSATQPVAEKITNWIRTL